MKAPRFFSGLCVAGAVALSCLAPAQADMVDQIKVQPDKAPDSTSLKSIVDTVTRGCETNDAKAIALYNYCMLTEYHLDYPLEPGGTPSLKVLNCYGWSLCGGLHTVESALWITAGWEHRYVGWNGHTTVEAKYDGRWHYLDTFLKFYAWEPDGKGGRTIASEDDLNNNSQTLIKDAFVLDKGRQCVYAKDNQFVMNGDHAHWRAPAFLSCGDELDGVIGGLKTHHTGGPEAGWAGINHETGSYSTDVKLGAGMSLSTTWDPIQDAWYWNNHPKAPAHTCSNYKDSRNDPAYGLVLEPYIKPGGARSYGTGHLDFVPSFADAAFLDGMVSKTNVKYDNKSLVAVDPSQPAQIVVSLNSPYILTKATGDADGADKVEVSIDGGKTYTAGDLKEFSALVKGHCDALLRISFKTLKALKVECLVQNNPGSLAYLSPGKNTVAVSVADPKALGSNKLVVTYAYKLGSRTKSFEQLCDAGKEIAKQHNAKWADAVTYIRKEYTAKDLPATFEVDCPTPKGQYPVYPRMMFMTREIVSPTGTPSALPEGAVAATAAAPDELQTLPDPFLIGTEPIEAIKQRPVNTQQIPLDYVQFCNEKGEVADTGTLTWPKNADEKDKVLKSAVLIGGQLPALPKGVAAVRLVVPIAAARNKTAEKLGLAFLKAAPEKGKACDFAALDGMAGSVVLPVQPDDKPKYEPAKPFIIDITRPIKDMAENGGKFNGIALRMAPDRGTDEGYTIHAVISNTDKPRIEIDTYADDAAAK